MQPKVIITLGNFSTKFVLAGFDLEEMKNIAGITQLHGNAQNVKIDDFEFTVVPMYHPAAALYNPNLVQVLKADFLKLKELLSE